MKNRKIILLLLFTALSLLLSSCGKKGEEKAEDKKEEKEVSEEENVEVPPVSIKGRLYGIVLESTETALTVQSDGGKSHSFQIERKEGEEKKLPETGEAIRIDYAGRIKGSSTSDATVTEIEESDKKPKLPKDALVAAGEVLSAFLNKDGKKLSKLCAYPLLVKKKKEFRIASRQEFLNLGKEEIFEKALSDSVKKTNLFLTEAKDDGFLLGSAGPNLILRNTEKGWKIIVFHYQ